MIDKSVTDALQEHLSTLCLYDFPCGLGDWRDDSQSLARNRNKKILKTHNSSPQAYYTTTLKDYRVNHEKIEVLQEYVLSKRSPWITDNSLSEDSQNLREIAIKSPWLITKEFVLHFFKDLRFPDKNITAIDPGVSKMRNLESLSLVANHIAHVDAAALPRGLRALELCANRLACLGDLERRPPPRLLHLGLGRNRLTHLADGELRGAAWPALLSLDLAHNSLADLRAVVEALATIPTLRSLQLMGNPLSLLPSYRGYVIDSMRALTILDDVHISADEKHYYRGLVHRKALVKDEVKLRFSVDYIKNLTQPDELRNPDSYPEIPVVNHKYSVYFHYLPPAEGDAHTCSAIVAAVDDDATDAKEIIENNVIHAAPADVNKQESTVSLKAADDAKAVEATITVDNAEEGPQTMHDDSHVTVDDGGGAGGSFATAEAQLLEPIKSTVVSYDAIEETIEVEWTKTVTRTQLEAVRDFLRTGMEVVLMEEKSFLYPPDELPQEETKISSAKKQRKDEKPKEAPKKEEKGKKKKKLDEDQLVVYQTVCTPIHSMHVDLCPFLDGERTIEIVAKDCTDSGGTNAANMENTGADKCKTKEVDKKSKAATKAPEKGGKSKGGGKKEEADDSELQEIQPLEFKFGIQLVHWKTAKDASPVNTSDVVPPCGPI